MGKLIVSWSPVEGHGATTTHTVGLASVISLDEVYRSLLTAIQFTPSGMEGMFTKGKKPLFHESGMGALERLVKAKLLQHDAVADYTDTVYKSRLDYLSSKQPSPGTQEDAADEHMLNTILYAAKQQYNLVWIDAGATTGHSTSLDLIKSADLVLVNLPQNKQIINQFFSAVPKELQDKPYFILLSQYDDQAGYSLRNIKRQNQVKVPMYAVPYTTGYRDAVNQEAVAEYFVKAIKAEKKDMHHSFVHALRTINNEILKVLEFGKAEEEDWT